MIEALDVARFVGAVTIGTYRFPILIAVMYRILHNIMDAFIFDQTLSFL
jgi:hypothetical protein